MVALAYRRFFSRQIPYLLINWLMVGFLAALFRWAWKNSPTADSSSLFPVQLILFLFFLLPILLSIGFAVRIEGFRRQLNQYGSQKRERMEEDFKTGDHFGDLYFTSLCLVVFQPRLPKRMGYRCIPYSDLTSIRVRERTGRGEPPALELKPSKGGTPYIVQLAFSPTADEIHILNLKLEQFRLGIVSPIHTEKKKNETAQEWNFRLGLLRDSPLPLILCGFGTMILYFAGLLGILSLPDLFRRLYPDAKNLEAHAAFWPGLFFLLLTALAVLGPLALTIHFIRQYNKNYSPAAIQGRMKACAFSFAVIGFILLIAFYFGSDACILEEMALGLRELTKIKN